MRIFVIFLFSSIVNSQNLIQNPSFELYSNCPNAYSQIDRVNNWNTIQNSIGTPDYYNSCGTYPSRVPSNGAGYQNAFEGNAYVGIIMYYEGIGDYFDSREYLQTQLSSPLISGQLYQLTFYVSLAESIHYASNNFGAVFTITPLTGDGSSHPLAITPHILNQNIISSTTLWTEISGYYLALGGEQYLTIGNFFSNNETQIQISNSFETFPMSYYYVDNVRLVNSSLGNNEFMENKVTICPNPVSDRFSISRNNNEKIKSIELRSLYNNVQSLNPKEETFDIRAVPSGVYYLVVKFESEMQFQTKIIKI